ncbi:TetR/AcrR family transcriptional regulator [Streptomyces sp. NPDC059894]|uniref:TetR/AcrR family transcriptional regulator n=1 Tax=unclassified Streptomyces TaxID=2593676 RepID=UPI0036627582
MRTTEKTRPLDPRVERTRAALFAAAVRLVSEQGTSSVAVTDLATAAGVSRQLVYTHFEDRDDLLVQAAVDLAERSLLAYDTPPAAFDRATVLPVAQHFAEHRAFYRALLTGSCAFGMTQALGELLAPAGRQAMVNIFDDRLTSSLADDLAVFVTGGAGAVVNAWLLSEEEVLDPHDLAERLHRLWHILDRRDTT